MADRFPDVFIQIHYHMRPGGVSTVINRYSDAFCQCGGDVSKSYIICKTEEASSYNRNNAHVVNVDECDYQTFMSIDQYKSVCDNLYKKTDEFLGTFTESNIAVVAHNLVLAKNPALASVFRHLACKWSASGLRFYSVIHDFAEEGRADMLEQLSFLENNGIDIRKEIYCIDAPVQCIVPGPGLFSLLHENGFPVSLLPNPVSDDKLVINDNLRKRLLNILKETADSDGCNFDIKKKIMYYPARLISRKNIYEAIAISCLVYDCNLLTGPPGLGGIDMERYELLKKFVQKHRLPVIFDAAGALKKDDNYRHAVVESVMNAADIILSTSIAEGFGYALFDSWIQDKPLIARRPSGYVFPDGWNKRSLYSYFPVPAEWISIDKLDNMYKLFFMRCYGEEIKWKVQDSFIRDGMVDFAVLSEQMQREILDMVFVDKVRLLKWKQLLESETSGWPGCNELMYESVKSVDNHRRIISKDFSNAGFLNKFYICFSNVPSIIPSTANLIRIREKFQSEAFFKLLLNGQIW